MDRNGPSYNTTTTSSFGYASQTFGTVSNQSEPLNKNQYAISNSYNQSLLPNGSADVMQGTEHLRREEEEEEGEVESQPTSSSARLCSVRGCPTVLDEGDSNKMCQHCRGRHRIYASTKRAKRKMEKAALAQAATVAIPGVLASPQPLQGFTDNSFASALQKSESSGTVFPSHGLGASILAMGPSTSWASDATLPLPADLYRLSKVDTGSSSGPWHNAIDPRLFNAKIRSSSLGSSQQPTVSGSSTLAHALTPVTRPVKALPSPAQDVSPQEEEEEENEVLATLNEDQPPALESEVEEASKPENELAEGDANGTSRVCSVKGCKTVVEASYAYKMCPHCRVRYQKYGNTKRAKWKAEREAFDREMAVLRKREDARRKTEGLLPLSKSPEELRQWELSILDQDLPLPDIETLANMTLTTAAATFPTDPTPGSSRASHQPTSSGPTPMVLAAISPLVAAGIFQTHVAGNQNASGESVPGEDANSERGFVHPLLVGHLAPYVEGIASSTSEANKAKRRASSTKVEEHPSSDTSALHKPPVDLANTESPQLTYPPSPTPPQDEENAASPVPSSDASMTPEISSHPVLTSLSLSVPSLTPLPARMCTISHCHRILPGYYRYKRCEQHRLQNRYHSQLKRVREKGGLMGCSSAGGEASASSSFVPSTSAAASAGAPATPEITEPSREDVSSSTLSIGATDSTPHVEQTTVGAISESLLAGPVDSGAQTSTHMAAQPQEGSSNAGPSSYSRHVSDPVPVDDAKAMALIMAEEDIMGVYAFREKMRKRLLKRKPRHPSSKAEVEDKEEPTPGDSAEMNEDSSGTEIPRQRRPKISKKLHPKGTTICFRSGCHNLVHPACTFKSCVQCREADKERRMFARLGPNTMAEMQPMDGSAPSGVGPVQGVLDWELGVISERTRWVPPLVERATVTPDSHNSEMDAEGEEFEEESSEDGSGDDEGDMVDNDPQSAQLPATSEIMQPSTSSVPPSGPPPAPVSSEPAQMTTGPTVVKASSDSSAFGRFRIHPPTPLPDSLSYPTMPYYSLMPPRYMPNIPNPPLNPVHIPFSPNPVGKTTRNGANNGTNSVHNSDHPPTNTSDVGLRTKDGSSAHNSTRVANETDKPTTSTEHPMDSSSSTTAGGSVAPSTTTPSTSSSAEAYKSSTVPNLDLSVFPPNSAAATIGRILAMNPGMPIDAFKEVIAVEASRSSTTGHGEVVGQLGGHKGATLLWKDAIMGQKKGKGKEKEVTDSHSDAQAQPSDSNSSEVAVSAQNRPSHWRGKIIFQVKPDEAPVEKQTQASKGKTKNPPPKQVEQKTLQNSWRVDPTASAGPTTSSISVLPRVIASPQEAPLAQKSSHAHPPAPVTVDSSHQTKAGSSKPGTSSDSKAGPSNASKELRSFNPSEKAALSIQQATGRSGTPTMPVPSTGISPYMVPYGSYTYPPMPSQSPYQYPNPYYPYHYPSYSYGYAPPFSGSVPPSSSTPPPPAPSPSSSQAKETQPDPKPSRKRKTRKGEAAAPTPPPSLEPCCVTASVDSSHLMHTYPSYSYPTTSYPPPYGYASSSYTSAYMQSSYYYSMPTGAGYTYPYTYPLSASAPPASSTPPLEPVTAPSKSTSKGKEKQGQKEAVPDKGSRKRQRFDADYLESYRAQTQQIQETLQRHAQIGLGGPSPKQTTHAPVDVTSAPSAESAAKVPAQDALHPTSPPEDDHSNDMDDDHISPHSPDAEPKTATTNTSAPRKCGYPSCRRTIPSDVHKMLCDRCRIRIKKQTERTKQRHKLQPRKSLNLLGNKHGSAVISGADGEE